MQTRHGAVATSWDELGWEYLPNGTAFSRYQLEDSDNTPYGAPVVFLARFPPNVRVPVHRHATDYSEIILEGCQTVGRQVHHAGEMRIVKAGTFYGPLVAGPEGVTVMSIFRDSRWEAIDIKQQDAGDAQYVHLYEGTRDDEQGSST